MTHYDFKARLEEIYPDLEFLSIVEAGSRAWGFASPDSDYDVRFLFVYKDRDKYTNVFENVEHFGFTEGLHDYSGWDVKKAMKLATQSNAALYEHVFSPIVYHKSSASNLIRTYTANDYCLRHAAHHYRGISESTHRQHIVGSGEPTMKKWFYIIRPMLCVLYIQHHKKMPPVKFENLLEGIPDIEYRFIRNLCMLLELKMRAVEKADAPMELNSYFSDWIKGMLETRTFEWIDNNIDETPYSPETINAMYRKILKP